MCILHYLTIGFSCVGTGGLGVTALEVFSSLESAHQRALYRVRPSEYVKMARMGKYYSAQYTTTVLQFLHNTNKLILFLVLLLSFIVIHALSSPDYIAFVPQFLQSLVSKQATYKFSLSAIPSN